MMQRGIIVSMALPFVFFCSQAQETPKGWHLMDHTQDAYYGISLNKAYQFLKDKHKVSKPVIVAVLDSGVDTTHEDLKNILWHNPKEIPGNGIDDDGNGYVDDIYGWNFLGGKDGRNVKKAPDERSRVFHRWKDKFQGKHIDTTVLSAIDKEEYNEWKKAYDELTFSQDDQMELLFVEITAKALKRHDKILRQEMGCEEYDCGKLEKFEPQTRIGKEAKLGYLTCIKLIGIEPDEKNSTTISELDDYVESKKSVFESKDLPLYDYRSEIVKDNYFSLADRFYGNNDVMGPDPMHGTHVCGLIGAQQNNGIGIGIADNVRIMLLRVVPNGDEYDKDVALAIRYAIDNGARVINMSFGKYFSPEKRWVDSAVKYAEEKDVLIVHSSGNESYNLDEKQGFPNPWLKQWHSTAKNFITVGASSDPKITGSITTDFSNYGKESVDVYAPGIKIYSTLPGSRGYGTLKGTSMSAPIVSGIAAMIRSYYPDLTAIQVKKIIEQSVLVPEAYVNSFKPGPKAQMVPFAELSKTGGIVNAFNAVILAEQVNNTVNYNTELPKKKYIAKQ